MSNVTNRAHILAKLRNAPQPSEPMTAIIPPPVPIYNPSEKVARLKRQLESMHAEVYITLASEWVDELKRWIVQKELKTLLYGSGSAIGMALEPVWSSTQGPHEQTLPQLVAYDKAIEQCKESLFTVDASITSTHGAITELGALILWPDACEPRLMSLVPPIHIAVLEAANIYSSFTEAIIHQQWATHLPTNALLISGPSKTADIELTLTFGIHGPKELIVFIVLPKADA